MIREHSNGVTVALVQELIQDLVNTGMSYARISTRLGFSPSMIQKIATKNSMPRLKTLIDIFNYYLKIFESPQSYGDAVFSYYSRHELRIKAMIAEVNYLLCGLLSTTRRHR